jgi:hypothetical protein
MSGSNGRPDFGQNKHNPSRDVYKTASDVVQLIQQAVAERARLIQQQGDSNLDKTTKRPWIRWSTIPAIGCSIAHSGEHYGQLSCSIAQTIGPAHFAAVGPLKQRGCAWLASQ